MFSFNLLKLSFNILEIETQTVNIVFISCAERDSIHKSVYFCGLVTLFQIDCFVFFFDEFPMASKGFHMIPYTSKTFHGRYKRQKAERKAAEKDDMFEDTESE